MIKIMFLSNNLHARFGLFIWLFTPFLDFPNKQEYLTTQELIQIN